MKKKKGIGEMEPNSQKLHFFVHTFRMSAFLNSIVKALQKVADWRVISIFLFRFKRNMAAVVMHMG